MTCTFNHSTGGGRGRRISVNSKSAWSTKTKFLFCYINQSYTVRPCLICIIYHIYNPIYNINIFIMFWFMLLKVSTHDQVALALRPVARQHNHLRNVIENTFHFLVVRDWKRSWRGGSVVKCVYLFLIHLPAHMSVSSQLPGILDPGGAQCFWLLQSPACWCTPPSYMHS